MQPAQDATELATLIVELLDYEPFSFLAMTAQTVTNCGWETLELSQYLATSPSYAGASLGVALQWLLGPLPPRQVHNPFVPDWLVNLDVGEITHARRRYEDDQRTTTSYLLELMLADCSVGTLHARIDHRRQAALTNVFVVDEPIDSVAALLCHSGEVPARPYREIQNTTATRALRRGIQQFDRLQPGAMAPAETNPWPGIRPLLSFVLTHFQ